MLGKKKMKKGIKIIIILSFICLLVVFYLKFGPMNEYKRLSNYINLNYKGIVKDINNNSIEDAKIDVLYDDGTRVVIVETKVAGFISNSKYYGYIYSSNDKPFNPDPDGYEIDTTYLKEVDKNTWRRDMEGDNYTLVKRIRKNFFYYEVGL